MASIKKEEQPKYLADCHRDLLLLEVENPDIKLLEELKSDIEEKGKKLLEELLTTAKFDLIPQLKSFYPLVSEKILNLGIEVSAVKTELLDFLLKEKILPADYKNFSIKGVTYSSLVAYYFEANIPTASKIKGLQILIKHGVPLMTLDKTGFPYVARVLLQPNHSLHALFKDNPDLFLFYRQFNAVLNMVAARADCTEEGKAQITQLIKDNNKYLANINTGKLISKLGHFTEAESAVKPIKNAKAQVIITKLRDDLRVSKLREEIRQKTTSGLKAIKGIKSVNMQKSMGTISMLGLEQLESDLVAMKESDIPEYEKIKDTFVTQQYNVLEFLSLYSKAINLEKQSNRGMGARKAKELTAEFDKLIKEMEEISQKMELPFSQLLASKVKTTLLPAMQKLTDAMSAIAVAMQLLEGLKANPATVSAAAQAADSPELTTSDSKTTATFN